MPILVSSVQKSPASSGKPVVGGYVEPVRCVVVRSDQPRHVQYMNARNPPPPPNFDYNSSLVPYPNENKWHHSLFERFCACESDCFFAWCCPCFAMAHISAKLEAMGNPFLSFNGMVFISCLVLVLMDCISLGNFILKIFLMLLLVDFRTHVRKSLNIPGSGCGDLCCACWCMPCVITQIMGTLWTRPQVHPGWSFSNDSVYIV
jgi:Cys-rich protein (TIGR01571 family)